MRFIGKRAGTSCRAIVGALIGLTAVGTFAAAAGNGGLSGPASSRERATRLDPVRRFTVVAGGDIMTGHRVRDPAAAAGAANGLRFDFRPQLADVRSIVEPADLAICHMEVPIGTPGSEYGDIGVNAIGWTLLLAPYEIAPGLASAGFDRCSTASNHSNDAGVAGIASTIEVLHGQGISTAGTARSADEAVDEVFDVRGVRVAHLAFTMYSNTNRPADAWRLDYASSPSNIANRVAAVRQAGAEVVIVSLHVSRELTSGPVPEDRSFVTELTAAADIDAVFIHGPHVVHPVEWVNETPVWWSLGNFFTQMGPGSFGKYDSGAVTDGLLAHVEFVETGSGRFTARPAAIAICDDFVDRTVRSATVSLRDPSLAARVRIELTQCLARVRAIVPGAL
jgi:poly-gamma-glutamate synthesis protein (capsule biosynthesis protein)